MLPCETEIRFVVSQLHNASQLNEHALNRQALACSLSLQESPCSSRFGGKDVKVNIASKPKLAVTSPKSSDEQTLKVKMPQGSTERSKKLIAKQKQAAATAAGRFEHLFQNKTTHHWPYIVFSQEDVP